ncbi:E3 ubiquitin-protein ligase ARIH2 isoform X1 [Ciona intestinalis]
MSNEEDAGVSDEDCSDEYDDEEDINNYYNNNEDDFADSEEEDGDSTSNNNDVKKLIQELEHFSSKTMTVSETNEFLWKDCDKASVVLSITPAMSRLVLQASKWKLAVIKTRINIASEKSTLFEESGLQNATNSKSIEKVKSSRPKVCGVCLETLHRSKLLALNCGHQFCDGCWKQHMMFAVKDGMSQGIPCMESECTLLCHPDFVKQFYPVNQDSALEVAYKTHLFRISVSSHYQLRFCPGVDCTSVIYGEKPKPRKVQCQTCKTAFCFECGTPPHIPTNCETIKKWLTKCADDSETANYISANTKDCPKCHICIEKNGGCNHIKCSKCSHNFCWMCLGDWKNHGNSYYECSRYKENPRIASKNSQTQAREALKKYLFYFQRWENHDRSLHLEAQARSRIQTQIEEKVNSNQGTWIDWQYLLRAGELLAQCRYTLQYTYPLVYYAETGPEKTLFEYQQAQLEVEIEGLAWKLEHAGEYQRGDIENQMDVAEKRRQTLLTRFVTV